MFGVCSGVGLLLSCAILDDIFKYGAQPLGFAPLQPFGAYPWQAYMQPSNGHWPTPGIHRVAAPSNALSGGSLMLLNQLSPATPKYGGAYSLGGLADSHLIPPPSLHGGEESSFLGLVPSKDTVDSESVVGVKPGDSGVVVGYQVGEFTHTWSAEQFVACFHIYPGFTGKVSSLIHFHLEPARADYSFLDQAVADFEQCLYSILTASIKTQELYTSLDEPDTVISSVSSGFLCSVKSISDKSKLQHAPSIRFHKLWCQARAHLAHVPLSSKMSASKLINYFSSHPEAFGFWSSTPPDNITLNPTNRKADQSLSEFQTGICAAVHATIDTGQLILQLRVALVDTISSLPILREELYLCPKCMNYFSRFMTFWTMLCPNELGTQLVF